MTDLPVVGAPHEKPEDCPTYYDGCRCTVDTLAHNIQRAEAAEQRLREVEAQKNGAYNERDRCVALAARMAMLLHWPAWLGRHVGGDWDDDWRNIIFIDLPSGQVSWHIHDSELSLVTFLPSVPGRCGRPWDGHDTAEKYRRCDAPWPPDAALSDRAELQAKVREIAEVMATALHTQSAQAIEAQAWEWLEGLRLAAALAPSSGEKGDTE